MPAALPRSSAAVIGLSLSKNSAFAVSFADGVATSSFLGFGARFVLLLLLGTCHNLKVQSTCCAQTPRMSVGWPLFRSKYLLPFEAILKTASGASLPDGCPHLMSSCGCSPLSFSTANLKAHVLHQLTTATKLLDTYRYVANARTCS